MAVHLETVGTPHCLEALPADGSPPMLLFEWEGCIENARHPTATVRH
ncbi:MAG: hypothetical protein ACYC3P_11980 [Bellilinea sp.]